MRLFVCTVPVRVFGCFDCVVLVRVFDCLVPVRVFGCLDCLVLMRVFGCFVCLVPLRVFCCLGACGVVNSCVFWVYNNVTAFMCIINLTIKPFRDALQDYKYKDFL